MGSVLELTCQTISAQSIYFAPNRINYNQIPLKKVLFYFALLCWLLTLSIHIIAIAKINVNDSFPIGWVLHACVFIVMLPVVFDLKKKKEQQALETNGDLRPISFFKIIFKDTPKWLLILCGLAFVYTFLNFFISQSEISGWVMSVDDVHFQNQADGTPTVISKEKWRLHQELRSFSGHWLFFFTFSLTVLFKYSGLGNEKTK